VSSLESFTSLEVGHGLTVSTCKIAAWRKKLTVSEVIASYSFFLHPNIHIYISDGKMFGDVNYITVDGR
jgi:hypothetical protein